MDLHSEHTNKTDVSRYLNSDNKSDYIRKTKVLPENNKLMAINKVNKL